MNRCIKCGGKVKKSISGTLQCQNKDCRCYQWKNIDGSYTYTIKGSPTNIIIVSAPYSLVIWNEKELPKNAKKFTKK